MRGSGGRSAKPSHRLSSAAGVSGGGRVARQPDLGEERRVERLVPAGRGAGGHAAGRDVDAAGRAGPGPAQPLQRSSRRHVCSAAPTPLQPPAPVAEGAARDAGVRVWRRAAQHSVLPALKVCAVLRVERVWGGACGGDEAGSRQRSRCAGVAAGCGAGQLLRWARRQPGLAVPCLTRQPLELAARTGWVEGQAGGFGMRLEPGARELRSSSSAPGQPPHHPPTHLLVHSQPPPSNSCGPPAVPAALPAAPAAPRAAASSHSSSRIRRARCARQ